MRASDLGHGLWLLLLLCLVVYVSGVSGARGTAARTATNPPAGAATARYQRIASASAYADELLLALAEPERIIALSRSGHDHGSDAFRYGGRALISGPNELERLLSLHADLLVVNHLGASSELARVRETGIAVCDLGEMRGLASLERHVLQLAELLGDRTRGERLWRRWSQALHSVARDIPRAQRTAALYVASYAGKLYGGTIGTSYHDVLEAAGLADLAAARYRDWPQFDPEELLQLDPPLIVTDGGMARQLCDNVWLQQLRACRSPAGIVELPSSLLGDAGLGMLAAALELRARVYPSAPP